VRAPFVNRGLFTRYFACEWGWRSSTRRIGGLIQTLDDKRLREHPRQTLDSLQIRFPSMTAAIEKLSSGQRQTLGMTASHG
jgi:ABC-type sugar transport system ATPase subunit